MKKHDHIDLFFLDSKTFPLDSSFTLHCPENLKLKITNIDISEEEGSCSGKESGTCSGSNEDMVYIKDNCNNKESCTVDIHKLSTYPYCSRNYGNINVSYFCQRQGNNISL